MFVELPTSTGLFSYNYNHAFGGIVAQQNTSSKNWYFLSGIPVHCSMNRKDGNSFTMDLPKMECETHEILTFSEHSANIVEDDCDRMIHQGLAAGLYFWMDPAPHVRMNTTDGKECALDNGILITGVNDINHTYTFLTYHQKAGIQSHHMRQGRYVMIPCDSYQKNTAEGMIRSVQVKKQDFDLSLNEARRSLNEYLSPVCYIPKTDIVDWYGIHFLDGIIAYFFMCCNGTSTKRQEIIHTFLDHQHCLLQCIFALSEKARVYDCAIDKLKTILEKLHCLRYMFFNPSNSNVSSEYKYVNDLLTELKRTEQNAIETLIRQMGSY